VSVELGDLADLVRRRRTNLAIDRGREVPGALLAELCELVAWAPNHKRTWPWELAWVTGDGRARLGEAAADAMAARGDDESKVVKTRTKYLRAPGLLVVGCAPGDTPLRTQENRDAVAAGVQTLLLGATAAGLASFWSSCPKGADEAVASVCGFPAGTAIIAMVYLGWPVEDAPVPARPPVTVRHVDT